MQLSLLLLWVKLTQCSSHLFTTAPNCRSQLTSQHIFGKKIVLQCTRLDFNLFPMKANKLSYVSNVHVPALTHHYHHYIFWLRSFQPYFNCFSMNWTNQRLSASSLSIQTSALWLFSPSLDDATWTAAAFHCNTCRCYFNIMLFSPWIYCTFSWDFETKTGHDQRPTVALDMVCIFYCLALALAWLEL